MKRGMIRRLHSVSGFRTAVVAFVLTVVLGIGGTAAYAYWSKSTAVVITGTTRSDLPPGTGEVTANPVLTVRPQTPTGQTCSARLSDQAMRPNVFADIRFTWAGAGATRYVVSVRSKDSRYVYDKSQTVAVNQADFRFERLKSDEYGKPIGGTAPFYTKYTVRVMPMNGNIPGDPLYFTYEYEHYKSDNCYYSEPTGASPLGDIKLVCALPPFTAGADYAEAGFTWSGSAGAASYSVSMTAQNGRGYGGEQMVSGTAAAFRVMQPKPVPGNASYFGRYDIRVQPMNGSTAGDPRYLTYQLGAGSHECWG